MNHRRFQYRYNVIHHNHLNVTFREKLHLGGYGELHYNDTETDGGSKSRSVDAHRFVLFFGYDFTDKVRFRSEFELEHAIAGEGLHQQLHALIQIQI